MPKIEIEVDQILTSAVAIDAIEPGDRLLVMNGVIIGLVERRPARQPEIMEKTATVAEAEKPPIKAPRQSGASARAEVLALLKSQGRPLSAREIGDLLPDDIRQQMPKVMTTLRNTGAIIPSEETRNKRFPAYIPAPHTL